MALNLGMRLGFRRVSTGGTGGVGAIYIFTN